MANQDPNANAGASTDNQVFIAEVEKELEGLKQQFKDKVMDQLADGGNLKALVTQFEGGQQRIEAQISQLKGQSQPIGPTVRKKLYADLIFLQQRVRILGERLEDALEAEWPPPTRFAWAVFVVGVALLVGVFLCYVNLHADRPLRVFLKGIPVENRVDLATKASAIKTRALVLAALPKPVEGQNVEASEIISPLRVAMSADLEAAHTTFNGAGFSEPAQAIFEEHYQKIKEELEATTPSGKLIVDHVDQILEHVLKAEEPFFWEIGAGRYVEVLFASFFGIMAFSLLNWWKHMRRPLREYWLAWHVAKIILSLVASVIIVAILSQVNFTTPTSLRDQTAVGLGTASMDFVVAFSMLAGYFSHLVVDYLEAYASRIFKLAE
jgi:hypothetical protein